MILALTVAAFALAFAPIAMASPTRVGSGPLGASIGAQRWHLALTGQGGSPVLEESAGRGAGSAGVLGFRADDAWWHATRILTSGRRDGGLVATLATNDPDGTRIRVRLTPSGAGVLALSATLLGDRPDLESIGIGFHAGDNERYLGFGERSNAVDQRGGVVENYVGEGAYPAEERALIAAFVPPWGYQQRDDATYFPVPWLLSTDGYGVLVDNTEASYFRLGSERDDAWSLEVRAAPPDQAQGTGAPPPRRLRLRFFAGPDPADVLRRFTAQTGRQPRAAAPWYFGPWFQPSGDVPAQVAELRDGDAPISVMQTYTHYLPCGSQRTETERERTAMAHAEGLAITTYFNPMICTAHEEPYAAAAAAAALTSNRDGMPYVYRYSTDTQFFVSQFDFSSANGPGEYGKLLSEAVADGYDGWMEDFGEYTPLDSMSANGMDGTRMHNLYPVQYHCAAQAYADSIEEPLGRFIRSGFTGVAPCAQIVWGGDPTTSWGFDGLQSAVRNGLTMGLSGISTWGSDIGGFFAILDKALTPELLERWVQFGAVSGVMRTQANGIAIPAKPRPQIWDPDQIGNWRRYAKLRTQLYPYIVAAQREYRRSGMPIMRHLSLVAPGDAEAAGREDEFMFGTDLLAAPVLEPGTSERELYAPRGKWVDVWRSVDYEESSGGLELGRARVLAGGRSLTLPAPADELPLLARAGTVLPLLPPDVDTLADPGDDPDVVGLADRRSERELLAFPRGKSGSRFDGGSLTSVERHGRWRLRVESDRRVDFSLQASLRTLRDPFEPCRVELDGDRLPRAAWSWDAAAGRLDAEFAAKRGTLVVAGCGGRATAPARGASR